MPKILVIDDDDELRKTLKVVLESKGHQVLAANNGQQGLQAFEETSCDLVVTDISMPEMDGLQAIVRLRLLSPKLPIIAISGMPKHSSACLDVAAQIGAHVVLEKPFSNTDLLAAINSALAGEAEAPDKA